MHEILNSVDAYKKLALNLQKVPNNEKRELVRYLCQVDLFFLLWYGCNRKDIARPWLLERCKEVQASPDGHLDLWAREHYKSTIITYGKTIQDILASHGDTPLPKYDGKELTFTVFSHTRPIAKGFLRQIKQEFEGNELLREVFPDIIWANPQKEAPKWSEDDGIVLKRKSNPKESTVEAWGIVDGQPTGKHFDVCVYDDVVTVDSVTPNMIEKTRERWELSLNLGTHYGSRRYIGTRYHYNDAYRTILEREAAKPRIYPATHDGTVEGTPVFLTQDLLDNKRRTMGPYTYSAQMLQNPIADENQGFKREWLQYHKGSDGSGMNIYITVDPANEKKQTNDFTVMCVIGLGQDQNYYLLDIIRDRLNLTERGDRLFELHKRWRPIKVGYEKYGMQADIQYFKERMARMNYHFPIQELGGKLAKHDRIKQLVPTMQLGRWYIPETLFKTDYEKKYKNIIDIFINEEYLPFPVGIHDDMLDALARIMDEDMGAVFPIAEKRDYNQGRYSGYSGSTSPWAA